MLLSTHSLDPCYLAGGESILPLVVHQPVFPAIWPAVQSHRCGLSTHPGCCCLPSEANKRNGATQIFRSFHRTDSSTTGGWRRWNILYIYLILSIIVYILDLKESQRGVYVVWVKLRRWCVWRRFCVSVIWGRVIYLFWVGQGYD